MLAGVDEVLVDLIGDDEQVVLTAIRAIAVISARVKTAPVGLCGEFSRMARVRGVTRARRAAMSGRNPGGRSVTGTRIPPAIAIEAA